MRNMDKPKRKTFYKHCIVHTCGNNSTQSPGKAYIRVPLDQELRRTWLNAVGRKTTEFSSTNKGLYVCEDHFELESDMENYLEWKLTGEEEIMKKTAVPRIIYSKGSRNPSDRSELIPLLGIHEEISIKNEPEDTSNEVNGTVSTVVGNKSSIEGTANAEGLVNTVVENRDLAACEKLIKQTPKPTSDTFLETLIVNKGLVSYKKLKKQTPKPTSNHLVKTLVEDRYLVDCKKLKKQTNNPTSDPLLKTLIVNKKLKKQTPKPTFDPLLETLILNKGLVTYKNLNLAKNMQLNIKKILDNGDSFGKLSNSEAQSCQSDTIKQQLLSICGVPESRDYSTLFRKYPSLSSKNLQQERRVVPKTKSGDLSCKKQDHKDGQASRSAPNRRRTVCPLCSKRIASHLPSHIERHHKDHKEVRLLRKLNPSSQERAQLLADMRKRGYFRLKIESNLIIPVRAAKKPDAKYFVCPHCLGHYSKRFLHRHVEQCDKRPVADSTPSGLSLSASQTFKAEVTAQNGDGEAISFRLRNEVFPIMRPNNVSFAARHDPLIRLYGDKLLAKPGSKATLVSYKIREMGRLLLALRSTQALVGLADALKPEMFDQLMTATKTISGYNPNMKSFKTPSLAMHMGANLRFLCGVALDSASDDRKSAIQHLKTLLLIRWSSELAGLMRREKSASQKPPPASDLKLLDEHIDALALGAFEKLNRAAVVDPADYRQLVECVFAKTVFFNRERVDLVQRLTLDAYSGEEREVSAKTLTAVEEVLAGRLKTVVCGHRKEGLVLIPDVARGYIDRLLRLRGETEVVAQFESYLFAAPGNEWIAGDGVLRKLARGSGVPNPEVLVSGRFRDQIATTLQLMAAREEELGRLATSVGLRSPENIHQKAELARVLWEKRQVVELPEKNLDETKVDRDVYNTESGDDDLPLLERLSNKVESSPKDDGNSLNGLENSIRGPQGFESTRTEMKVPYEKWEKVTRTRIPWSKEEKSVVRKHFSKHIRKKISPKRMECEEFLRLNPHLFHGRGWVQLKAFVYNTYRMMHQ